MVTDTQTGKKIEYMEVCVTVKVDVSDCEKVAHMYARAENIVNEIASMIGQKFSTNDWYEIPRVIDDDGNEIQADPRDE